MWTLAWEAARREFARYRAADGDCKEGYCVYNTERLVRDLWATVRTDPFPSVASALLPGMSQLESEDRLYAKSVALSTTPDRVFRAA